MKKAILTMGLVGLLGATLVACAPDAPQSSSSDSQSSSEAGDSAKTLQAVGVTVGSLGNPFFVQLGEAARAKAQTLDGGEVSTTVVSSDYDLNQQINQVEDFIAAGVNLILLNAADSQGIAPAVIRAKAAGVTVVAVDVGAEGGVDATVTSNNIQAGELACQYIADRLGGQGRVIIINGPPVSAVMNRVEGCTNVLANYPDLEILSQDQNAEGSREGGLRVMSDLLTAFSDIDAVFAINDPSGIGAELAAKQAGRDEFFIVGVDGAPEAVEALQQTDSLFVATAAQYPGRLAEMAVEVGTEILQGNPPAQETILVPVELITQENVDQYEGWGG